MNMFVITRRLSYFDVINELGKFWGNKLNNEYSLFITKVNSLEDLPII